MLNVYRWTPLKCDCSFYACTYLFYSEGASLKHASETWGIPKTVLWRKVQRDGGKASLRRRMRKYTPAVMDLACNALLSGHSITRVANQFKVRSLI